MRPALLLPLLVAALLAMSGCRDDAAPRRAADGSVIEPLPTPEGASGSVTGLSGRPGPGDVPISGEPPPPEPLLEADEGFGVVPLEENPETGLVEDPLPAGTDAPVAAPSSEPGEAEAVALVRDYYGAIDAGDHARAYARWSDGGRASGQSPEQFAAGFGSTARVSVQVQAPRAGDAAAGSRFMEVPVSVTATQRDGTVRRYAGTYVLRRTVVDGSTGEQRAWHIASAQLRDVTL